MLIFLLSLFSCTSSSLLLEYRFGYNYGQVFRDFTENLYCGVNGLDSSTATYDTIATDRGSYFLSSLSYITLPDNSDCTGFTLSSTFSVFMWIIVTQDSDFSIFQRFGDSSSYFTLNRFQSGVQSHIVTQSSDNSFNKDSVWPISNS